MMDSANIRSDYRILLIFCCRFNDVILVCICSNVFAYAKIAQWQRCRAETNSL